MSLKFISNSEHIKTLRRMIIIGISTLIIGIIINQFLSHGIRFPILLTSIPCPFRKISETVSCDEALKLLNEKKAVFVDTRSEYEFDMDHIPSAISLPVIEFMSNPKLIEKYDANKDLPAILYSAKARDDNIELMARCLRDKGVQKVMTLNGGFDEGWLKKGFPSEY